MIVFRRSQQFSYQFREYNTLRVAPNHYQDRFKEIKAFLEKVRHILYKTELCFRWLYNSDSWSLSPTPEFKDWTLIVGQWFTSVFRSKTCCLFPKDKHYNRKLPCTNMFKDFYKLSQWRSGMKNARIWVTTEISIEDQREWNTGDYIEIKGCEPNK